MSGFVTDYEGNSLPGANVVATHIPTGTRYGTSVRADGNFNIPNMKSGGPYTVTVSFVGYKEEKLEGVQLGLGQNVTLKFKLIDETKQIDEVVITASRDKVFNADKTGATTNIGTQQLSQLPTLNRSLNDFTRLTPQSNGSSFGGRDNRFNNLTIDGAVNNDVFGLTGTPGGQTNTQPISLDAIQEIQVSLAPYDVRQGSFTGAGINAVTRSGTNELSGSAYAFFRNESLAGEKVRGLEVPNNDFSQNTFGFRIGGAAIKNKLFFFVNGEKEVRTAPPVAFRAARSTDAPGSAGTGSISRVTETDALAFRNHLINEYDFDPGRYEGYAFDQENNKIFVRLDYNINDNHRLTLRHNYVKAFRDIPVSNSGAQGGRQNSNTALPFESANYTQNNTTNSTVLELNSTFKNNMSNNLILTRTTVRDFRASQTGTRPFPLIDIENGGTTYMSAGFEPFSPNNKLDQDLYQLTNNLSIFSGSHVYTIGTHNEFYKFVNGFTPRFFGNYIYNSLNDFITDVAPREYQLTFSKLPNQAIPFAEFSAFQLGFYVQDEWQIKENFKLTTGIRLDIPRVYENNAPLNQTFLESFGLRTNEMPSAQFLVSPRVGFNWDVTNDAKTQVRGGVGVFTGRPPFVWLSNQVGNNGVSTGSLTLRDAAASAIRFNPDQPQFELNDSGVLVDTNGNPIPGVSSTANIAVVSPDFKFPQLFRANLAVDKKLPGGVVLSLEGIYSKDINAIIYKDLNLNTPIGRRDGDNREVYSTSQAAGGRLVDTRFTDVSLLDNTSRAYQYSLTAQATKSFAFGLDLMAAYNYGTARDVTSANSSIARSSFTANAVVGNPNEFVLGISDNQLQHRFIASVSYAKKYAKYFGTSVSFFYTARSGNYFSYTYASDLNNDGINGNDLIYIPRTQNEIILVPSNAADTRTPAQIWQDLNTYITNDKYLSGRKGQFAERNGAETPWSSRLDFSIRQDFYVNVKGKTNTIQLSFDVFNFGNMLNSDWGVVQVPNRTQLLNFRGSVDGTATGRPVFSFDNLPSTFRDNIDPFVSKWEAQVGIRYIFN
jgi:outer membrane receptor protein involved in Fe transport